MPARTFADVLIGEIKAEMARQDVTQTELARRLGTSQSSVNRRLRGNAQITAADIEHIADALGTTVHSLGWPFEAHGDRPARSKPRRTALVPAAEPAQSLWDLEEDGGDD
jgi:transcriptional regulator with XRE-family HTH domain